MTKVDQLTATIIELEKQLVELKQSTFGFRSQQIINEWVQLEAKIVYTKNQLGSLLSRSK